MARPRQSGPWATVPCKARSWQPVRRRLSVALRRAATLLRRGGSRSTRQSWLLRAVQQGFSNLVVGHLVEFGVPLPDRDEVGRRVEADHVVVLRTDALERLRWSDRHREQDAVRALRP